MIVAITGGTGFIGKKLAARLVERGDTVHLLTRSAGLSGLPSQVRIHQCDLVTAKQNDLAAILDGVEVIYHCAGQLKNESTMRALHVDGTRRLVEAASGRIAHWVQLSSVGVYGPVKDGYITEASALNPAGEYETTKAESDRIVIEGANRGGYSYSMLRPSTVFGNDMPNQSLAQWVDAIRRGLFFYIGKRGAMVNYVHVDSVVDAMLLCATSEVARNRLYIVSEEMEIERFVGVICETLGRPAPRLRMPEGVARIASVMGALLGGRFPLTQSRIDALTGKAVYSSSKIAAELGYVPSVPLEAGLRRFVENWNSRHGR